ncbi:hypothetical protein [Aliarcobacter skirrowii]|uniref:hypothetical protein n=1 Tax=Aliarcobacter skirrowii TaxID=28200 RepID=UPI00082B601D|nr:hypothetical protein [Aliarcobacter skirrowii]
MDYLLLIILTIILIVLFIYFTNKNVIKKTQSKLDVINRYKISLLKILEENKDDKDLQISQKIEFLKKVNDELSRNIFFEKHEIKTILEEFSKMEYK